MPAASSEEDMSVKKNKSLSTANRSAQTLCYPLKSIVVPTVRSEVAIILFDELL